MDFWGTRIGWRLIFDDGDDRDRRRIKGGWVLERERERNV